METIYDPFIQRKLFPSLGRKVKGQAAVFFDGPGGTQTPQSVIEAMSGYLAKDNSNLGGAFATSQQTDRVAAEARQAMADFFNARRPEEIAFGQNMTSLTFAVSRAISRDWQPGDEVILTRLDHDANISPWLLAAEEHGVKVRWLDFEPSDCMLELHTLPDMLNEKTRLVAVSYASNAVGSITDIKEVTRMVHDQGALVLSTGIDCLLSE